MNRYLNNQPKTFTERLSAPTSKFFRKLRLVGLILIAGAGAIIASPALLPVSVVAAAGYLLAAGTAIVAVAQVTTDGE